MLSSGAAGGVSGSAPTLVFIIGGAFVLIVLARYFPSIAGWVALALILAMLYAAERTGTFANLRQTLEGGTL